MAGLRLRIVQAAEGQIPSQPEIALGDDTVIIGRSDGNSLVLPDPLALVSRQHCRIDPLGDSWQLTDLSTNGSYVNDVPVGKGGGVPIHAGDTGAAGRLRAGGRGSAWESGPRLSWQQYGFFGHV